jgi:site-specific recombinase XerD
MEYLRARAVTVGGRRDLLIVDIMLNTGLRASELCRLRVCDTPVVIGRPVIEVYKGKNQKDRTIPVSERLAKKIAAYVSQIRPKTLPRYVKRKDYNRALFYSQRLKPLTRFGLWVKLVRIGIRLGLVKRLHPHMLRHSFATDALLRNEAVVKVQRYMGHRSLNTTIVYTHVCDDVTGGAGARIDHVFC